jgi:hypothetical protein
MGVIGAMGILGEKLILRIGGLIRKNESKKKATFFLLEIS